MGSIVLFKKRWFRVTPPPAPLFMTFLLLERLRFGLGCICAVIAFIVYKFRFAALLLAALPLIGPEFFLLDI